MVKYPKIESSSLRLDQIKKGFTLIEVVIAIFIATVGIMGAFSIIQQVVAYTSASYNRLTAAYLAQEGIEVVRNIRDGNWLKGGNWQIGLTGCEVKGCEANYNDTSLASYGDRYLKIDGGFYNYDSGNDTKYKRKIFINPATGPDGSSILKVVIVVEWQKKGKTDRFSVQENLYNWK